MLIHSKLVQGPRPEDMKQNVITERNDPLPKTLPQLPQEGGFYSRGATDTGQSIHKLFKNLKKCLLTTNILVHSKMQNENSKSQNLNVHEIQYRVNMIQCNNTVSTP